MKKIVKILTVLLIVLMLVNCVTPVFAANLSPDDITPNGQGDTSALTSKAGQIMAMIRNIAVIASVIVLMVIGVKFILGSVEEKAEYKKSFMPLIVGIVIVVGATSIASFLFNMAS